MAGSRLTAAGHGLMPRQPGWLALLLALFVIILCLSQRLGLLASCSASVPVAEATQSFDSSPTAADSSSNTHGSCSLSEQLLSKAWNQLEPMLAVLLLWLSLWLLPPRIGGYFRLLPPPQPCAGRRRHLVLCVFRE